MLDERTLSREPIYEGRVVKLYLETVELPDGNVAKREVVRHGGAVAIVPLHDDGRVTLVRQYRLPAGQNLLEVPAGTLEPGEDPYDCAVRELQEEANLKPGNLEPLGGIFVAPGYTSEFIHLYLATDMVESSLEGDADEFVEVVTLPLDEALAMIDRGELQDGKTITALLLAARRRQRAG